MKPTPLPLFVALLLATVPLGRAQEARPLPTPAPGAPNLPRAIQPQPRTQESQLTKFDLDFKGGTPKELVAAISRSMGRPLNTIVPDDLEDTMLPALSLTGIDVQKLFAALYSVSIREVRYPYPGNPPNSWTRGQIAYGFKTSGEATDDSIWYFYKEDNTPPTQVIRVEKESPKRCAIFQLSPYLERYKVEDITTAVETAWKMLGERNVPEMKFHKDTQLLIAVGAPEDLDTIASVLSELKRGTPATVPIPSTLPTPSALPIPSRLPKPTTLPAPKTDKQ